MAEQTIKQGLGGASYDTSKVFDPTKKAQAIAEPPKTGLDVPQNAGTSTIAGTGYYAGRTVPSSNPMAIAGMEASKPQTTQTAPTTAIQPIAGTSAPISTGQSSSPLGMPDKAPAIAGVNAFSFDSKQPAGGLAANNSGSDWSPGSKNVATAIAGFDPKTGRTYDEQVIHAAQVNEAGQRDLMRMSPREQAAAETAKNRNFGSFIRGGAAGDLAGYESRRNAIAGQLADTQAQRIAGITAKAEDNKAAQNLAGVKYTAEANVTAAGIAGAADITKAQQTALSKQQEQGQKDYSERVKGLVSGWEKLNVPTEVAPKLNYYARIHAQAEDPKGNIFMMAPNTKGGQYAALPKAYQPHYEGLLKSGISHNDAAARIYGVAQKNGHAVDVPDFARFQTRKEAVEG